MDDEAPKPPTFGDFCDELNRSIGGVAPKGRPLSSCSVQEIIAAVGFAICNRLDTMMENDDGNTPLLSSDLDDVRSALYQRSR
jgi:hypothetical protein